MKLEEAEIKNYNMETTFRQQLHKILNIYEKNPNIVGKPSFKNGAITLADMDIALLNAEKTQSKPQKHRERNKSFYQYMKKTEIYQHNYSQ